MPVRSGSKLYEGQKCVIIPLYQGDMPPCILIELKVDAAITSSSSKWQP